MCIQFSLLQLQDETDEYSCKLQHEQPVIDATWRWPAKGIESPIGAGPEPSHWLAIDANLCRRRSAHRGRATHDAPPAAALPSLRSARQRHCQRTDRMTTVVAAGLRCRQR